MKSAVLWRARYLWKVVLFFLSDGLKEQDAAADVANTVDVMPPITSG